MIDPLLLFCDCFSAGLEKVCQPASDPAVRRILQRATRGLGELAQSAVGDYVTEVREELLLRAELRPGPRSGANPETTPTPVPMREAVEALVSTLKSVYGCVRQVDQRLPNPALVERVSAVCMECVRKCGESVCDRTQKHLAKVIPFNRMRRLGTPRNISIFFPEVLLTSHQAVKRFHRFHTLRRRSCLSLTVVAAHLSPGKLAALCRPAEGSSGSPQLSVSVWLDDKVGEAQRTGTAALTGRDGKRVSARALPVDGDNAGSLAWNQSLDFPLASVHDTLRLKLAVEAFAPGSGSESAADPAASGSVASFSLWRLLADAPVAVSDREGGATLNAARAPFAQDIGSAGSTRAGPGEATWVADSGSDAVELWLVNAASGETEGTLLVKVPSNTAHSHTHTCHSHPRCAGARLVRPRARRRCGPPGRR